MRNRPALRLKANLKLPTVCYAAQRQKQSFDSSQQPYRLRGAGACTTQVVDRIEVLTIKRRSISDNSGGGRGELWTSSTDLYHCCLLNRRAASLRYLKAAPQQRTQEAWEARTLWMGLVGGCCITANVCWTPVV